MKKRKLPTRLLVTGGVILLAAIAVTLLVRKYLEAPWTRDGQVSADIVFVTPRISGQVVEVNVEDNQLVRKGDLLLRIDPVSYELQVKAARVALESARQQVVALEAAVVVAEAGVLSAEQGVETAKGQIEAAAAQVEAAREQAKSADASSQSARASIAKCVAQLEEKVKKRDRAAKLAKEGAGSIANAESTAAAVKAAEASLDAARADLLSTQAQDGKAAAGLDQARANLIVARTGLGSAEAGVATAKANLEKARADLGTPGEENVGVRSAKVNLENAELDLAWTTVRAPSDGYATNLSVLEGDYATAGKPVLAFVDSTSFYVLGFFKETQIRHMKKGDQAVVTLMSHRDQPIEGEVESIGWAISPPNLAQTGRDGDGALVPVIQPSFDWIRLAQRVPVRVKLTRVPEGIQLISGTTTSVSIRPSDEE